MKYNNTLSTVKNVRTGIGQGTILGPILFIFYINDLTTVLHDVKINMYADDCILYCSGNDWDRMHLRIQPEVDAVHEWFSMNRLKLNIKKSSSLIIGLRSKLSKIDLQKRICIDGVPLKFVDSYRYLGTIIDREMSLTSLLSNIKKSVLSKLFTLRKLRRYITEKCAIAIYKQTILPVFDYVGFMLISCNQSDRHDLQVIQNDALRTCYNVRRRDRLSVKHMHAKAKLLSLDQRRRIQLLGLMFIHKYNHVNMRIPPRNTRDADRELFYVERFNNCKYKNSPYYKGAEIWKTSPIDLTQCPSVSHFKMCLKRLYKSYKDEY